MSVDISTLQKLRKAGMPRKLIQRFKAAGDTKAHRLERNISVLKTPTPWINL